MQMTTGPRPLYLALWRWHFYAAWFVLPFILVLSTSGALMLLRAPLEAWQHAPLLHVPPGDAPLPAARQLEAVQRAYPEARVLLYVPPRTKDATSQFSITPPASAGHQAHGGHDAPTLTVYVNPYSADVLGARDPADSFYAWVRAVHSSLLLGAAGNYLIEAAAGLAVLMVVSGLVLAWPRPATGTLRTRWPPAQRAHWRGLHALLGLTLALPLLFFLISGLAWTSVWGGQLVQAWSSVPGTTYRTPATPLLHRGLSRAGLEEMPWAVAQTPLPGPAAPAGTTVADAPLDIDTVVRLAARERFTSFRVHLPTGPDGVWTISSTTIAGDVRNPVAERILHLDPASGQPLADLRFADYPALGQAMSAAIPFHQGGLGAWNVLINLALCGGIIGIALSGVVMSRKRRPGGASTLAPPPAPGNAWKVILVGMLVLSLIFPVSAAAISTVMVIDWVVDRIRRQVIRTRMPAR